MEVVRSGDDSPDDARLVKMSVNSRDTGEVSRRSGPKTGTDVVRTDCEDCAKTG